MSRGIWDEDMFSWGGFFPPSCLPFPEHKTVQSGWCRSVKGETLPKLQWVRSCMHVCVHVGSCHASPCQNGTLLYQRLQHGKAELASKLSSLDRPFPVPLGSQGCDSRRKAPAWPG